MWNASTNCDSSFARRRSGFWCLANPMCRRKTGPGFIYDATYYTPWWRDLLWPAFGGRDRPRKQNLEALRERGVWLLDMSVIALSGYRNICPAWPPRPFDSLASAIFQASWTHFVQQEWEPLARVPLVYFERAAALLPETARQCGTPLRFNGPRPVTCLRYSDPAYRFGTARFVAAARAAGV